MRPDQQGDGLDQNHTDEAQIEDEDDLIEVIDLDEELGDPEDWEEDGDHVSGEEDERPKPEFQAVDGVATISPEVTFGKHEGSVFAVGVDGVAGRNVISGGEDDKAFVWNSDDGSVLFECEGHKDSVTQVGITADNVFAFSADMAGTVKVWRMADGKEVWTTDTSDLKVAKWHPKAHVLFAGCDDGSLFMWQLPQGLCKYHQAGGPITALEIFPDGKKMVYAYGEGAVAVFDLKDWKVLHTFNARTGAFAGEILTLDVNAEGTLVVSGNLTGAVIVYHAAGGRILWENQEPDFTRSEEEERAVEWVSFARSRPWLAAGCLNGAFCIYDLMTLSKRHSGSHPHLKSVTKIVWHPTGDTLFLSHLNGVVSMWDARAATLQKLYHGEQEEILDFVVSTDGQKLVLASDDGNVCVFRI